MFSRSCRALAAATLALGCLVSPLSAPADAANTSASTSTGVPHSPVGRKPAPLKVIRAAHAVVREVDLGDANVGPKAKPASARVPVRGLLITPLKPKAHAPLVVFSHLRMPGCSTMVFAFPCPKGSTEMRYDRGMRWFGEGLAARGYSVLIPDLAPLYAPELLDQPYSQGQGWLKVVGQLRDQAMAANAGRHSAWGTGLTGMIDGRDTTLMVHSRSAYLVNTVIDNWQRSTTPIGQVMAYGGACDTPSTDGTPTPVRPNIPFLGVAGTDDGDVDQMGSQWFTAVIGQKRTAPAFQVEVEGYGHTLINRELSSRGIDDRDGEHTRTTAQHETLLLNTAVGWLAHTVRGKHVFPTGATEPLPRGLIGVPARYLVATPGAQVRMVSGQGRWATPLGTGASVRVCRTYPHMDPTPYPDRCPDIEDGSLISDSLMTRIALGPTKGARLAVRASRPRMLALHVTPTQDRADKRGYTPLTLTIRMSDGRRIPVNVGQGYQALREWPHPNGVGLYYPLTARVMLPEAAQQGTMVAVEVTGPYGGSIDLRGVDVLTR